LSQTRWWTLLAVCLATFVLIAFVMMAPFALPDVQRSLNASLPQLQWVVNAYTLLLATLLLTAGSLADRLGRRRVFATGLAIYSVAAVLCALAPTATLLDLACALLGAGGAIMFSTSLALLGQEFHGSKERGTAFGTWGTTIAAALAVGPLAGGFLTGAFGWRAIFAVLAPITIVAFVISLARVPESTHPEAHQRHVDWIGFATFTIALFLLIFVLIQGNSSGFGSPLILAAIAGFVVSMAAFIAAEVIQADHGNAEPMLDLTLFRKPAFTGGAMAALTSAGANFGLTFYIVIYLQKVRGNSPLETGLWFLPITGVAFLASPLAGRLMARVAHRWIMGAALLLVAIGDLLLFGQTATSPLTTLLPGFVLIGIGAGAINPPLGATAVGVVPPERAGMASGVNTTFRQLGTALGIAGLGAFFQSDIARHLPAAFSDPHVASLVAAGNLKAAAAAAPGIGGAAETAFMAALNDLFLVIAAVALLGAICALTMVRQKDFERDEAPAADAQTSPRVGPAERAHG